MAITLLPKPAIAQLGSTLTIASSAVLVKELLDNSLDAGSTAVDIFISTDTVERIEVRDNGCGIPAEDFHLLGQRSCTSKLDNVGDLERIGGSSLGFRGQALASIHELADVAIVTRTSQETVGSVLRLSPEGGAIKVQSKASPPGTTVTVHGLFQCFPVRRRVAEAGAKKTVASITELLKGYAMARPHISFGPFISVDSRPLSPERGTVKAISLFYD
ncbi:hypothetical protein P8C59_003336 [Phyllachora maydis]|uniref:Uncharacterized protein n=1 Tax=Phyllachora maydis TaxID=1825666 RepID=A0AAD9I010_9PEZI|nr:hypothetical protein P8C59_003336 [Phyllachora maydis]